MGEILKLSELLGTKYPCDWHTMRLDSIFSENIGGIIDLAGCNFTPGAATVMRRYEDSIHFVNTEDAERDYILEHNRKARSARMTVKLVSIPDSFESIDDIAKYIRELKSGIVLDATGISGSVSTMREICNLVQILRPDVMIDFGSKLEDYFKSVRVYWISRAKPTDAYWEAQGNRLVKRVVENGMVRDVNSNLVKESDYILNYLVLPYRFGTKCLVNDAEFRDLIERSLKNIEALKKRKPAMKDYLK